MIPSPTFVPTARRLAACGLVSALTACSASAQTGSCARIEVHHLRPGQGSLMLAAYGDAASFLRKTAEAQLKVEVKAETMQVRLCGLGGDAVALTLFQDLNDNRQLDLNPFGVPTEPWGASGRATPMSAPTWESARVPLDGSAIVIALTP